MDPEWKAWKAQVDKSAEVHPVDWQDELGPLTLDDLATFVFHMQQVEAVQNDRAALVPLCVELGYQDYWQYLRVYFTFLKYYAKEKEPTKLRYLSFTEPDFSNAIMSSQGIAQRFKAKRALAANPQLLEPIDGVTVDRWAEIHTHKAHKEHVALPELLAGFQLDVARWEAIDAGWTQRCSEDVDGALGLEFRIGQAQHSQGRYAASARAAAAAMRGDTGQLLGNEPMSQDEYNKLTLDMQSWAMQGLDASAKAKTELGITQGDLQDLALYWNTRWAFFGRDFLAHVEEATAAVQEMNEAQVDLDADLQLGQVFSGAAAQPSAGPSQVAAILRCVGCGAPQQQPGQFTCGYCGGQIVQA